MYVTWNSSSVLTLRKFLGKFLRLSREGSSIFKGSFFDFQGSYQRFLEVRFDFTQVWFTWLCVKSLEILLEKVDMFNVSFGNRGRPGPVSRIRRWCTAIRWSSSPAGTGTTRSRSSTSMTPPRSSGIRCHQEERRQQRGIGTLLSCRETQCLRSAEWIRRRTALRTSSSPLTWLLIRKSSHYQSNYILPYYWYMFLRLLEV